MTLPADPLKWAVTAFRDGRNLNYETYAKYLAGKQSLEFATDRFRLAFGDLVEALTYNRCEAVVDAHADRLQVAGFAADDGVLAQAAQALWDANRMDVREGHVATDAFALGDSYVAVAMHPEPGRGVQFWTLDPRNVRVHYSLEAPGEIDLAAQTWQTEDGHSRLTLYFADHIEKYVSRTRTPSGLPVSAVAFERYQPADEPWPVVFPPGRPVPVFAFANNGRTDSYGASELRNVIPMQDGVNKTLADMVVAMEFAAFPQRVLLGVDPPTPEEQAIFDRFMTGVDRILTLSDANSKIGEFSAVNIAQYLAIVEFWDKAISRVTKVPTHYLGMTGDFPSGRALRIAEGPFIAKLEDRQRAFGAVWSDIMTYALILDGKSIEPGDLRVNWKSAAPLSSEDQLDLALGKKTLGMPFPQILRELGYEPTQLATILEDGQTDIEAELAAVREAKAKGLQLIETLRSPWALREAGVPDDAVKDIEELNGMDAMDGLGDVGGGP